MWSDGDEEEAQIAGAGHPSSNDAQMSRAAITHGSNGISAPNPNALALQNPPPAPRAQYLGPAKNARGSASVSGPDFFSGAPLFDLSIDDAFVFDCAGDAATAAGCKATVVSPADPTYNYDLTVWYPCTSSTRADQNCCFLPAHGYSEPFDDWCISVGSNAFIIAAPMTLSPSQ